MKNIITPIILFTYFCSVFSTGVIYCGLMLNSSYIQKELCVKKDEPGNCCKGKCYISKELNAGSEKTSSGKRAGNNQNENLSPHLSASNSLVIQFGNDLVYGTNSHRIVNLLQKPSVPPPECV